MRLRLLILLGVLSAMTVLSSAALAKGGPGSHPDPRDVTVPHQICTPGNGNPEIPSPHHADDRPEDDPDPTDGKILNNKHVDEADLKKLGFIPHHHLLHHGPSEHKRKIKVDRWDEDCDEDH